VAASSQTTGSFKILNYKIKEKYFNARLQGSSGITVTEQNISAKSQVKCLRGNFFQYHVFAMKSVQNLKSFWRSSQNYFVLALFSSLES
jgi:hypothetical protein